MSRRLLRTGAALTAVSVFLAVTSVSRAEVQNEETTPIIDVLALYTPTAERDAASAAGITKTINDQVILADEVMTNSDVGARLRLVGIEKLTGYQGPEEVHDAIDAISADETVAKLRDKAGADLVTVFVGAATGPYGTGNPPLETPADPESSSTMAYTALVVGNRLPAHALAHEIGHNLGGGHDWVTNNSGTYPGYPDDHGYGSPYKDFVTAMSYQGICDSLCYKAVPFYSSPAKTWNGEPLGVSRDADRCDPDVFKRPADNARVIAANVVGVSRYRQTAAASATRSVLLTSKASPVEGGRAAAATPGPYAKDTKVTVTAVPEAGYHFTGWELDGKASAVKTATLDVKMDAKHDVVAKFTKNELVDLTVEIKPSAAAGSLVSHARTQHGVVKYPKGTIISGLSPVPAPGWEVESWNINGKTVEANKRPSPQIGGPTKVTVNFAKVMPTPPTGLLVSMEDMKDATQRPVLTGTATPNSSVTIADAKGTKLGTTRVVGDGKWQLRPPWDLPGGLNTLSLTTTKDGAVSPTVTATVSVTKPSNMVPANEVTIHTGEFSARRGGSATVDIVLETCETFSPRPLQQAVLAPQGFVIGEKVTARYGSGQPQELQTQRHNDDTVVEIKTPPSMNTSQATKGPLTYTITLRAQDDAEAGTFDDGLIHIGDHPKVKLRGTVRP